MLKGRRILVTGAATGIGAAAVTRFSEDGASVAAVFNSTPPSSELECLGSWFQADLRDPAAAQRVVAEAVKALGGVNVLLHAAGLWQPSSLDQISEADLDAMLATNLKTTVFTNQAVYGVMRASGGAIINVASAEGELGSPFAPFYSASKAAVLAWTRSAARGWGRSRVTVNAIAPAVESPGSDRLRECAGPGGAEMLERRIAEAMAVAGSNGPGRLGDAAADLGPFLSFLASPGAAFITGQLLAVDGGTLMV